MNKQIYITKPGLIKEIRPYKSNMQLRELIATKSILGNHYKTELVTVGELLRKDTKNSIIIVFVSVPKFDDELNELMVYADESAKFIFIHNDPRLWFNVQVRRNATLITNATRHIHDMLSKCQTETSKLRFTNVISAPLWTMPAFYLSKYHGGERNSVAAFYCLHFNEMDKRRQETVLWMKEQLQDDMRLFGDDYPSGTNCGYTLDSIKLGEFLKNVRTIPVIFEQEHIRHGALTSRISEAICSGCMPILIIDNLNDVPEEYKKLPYMTRESYVSIAKHIKPEIDNGLSQYLDNEQTKLTDIFIELCESL